MSGEKNDEVDPSMAFCGIPEPSVEICIGALPAATFRTVKGDRKFNNPDMKFIKSEMCVNRNGINANDAIKRWFFIFYHPTVC